MQSNCVKLYKCRRLESGAVPGQLTYIKVARRSFSGSIPPKFEHTLRRSKQRFVKIATTVVLNKDESLLWSWLQRHRSCHSNEMTLLPILFAAVYLGTGNCSSKIVHGSFFLQWRPRCSWSLSEICKSLIEIFWDEVFMVRNSKKWTVTCTKRSALDMQFHLTVFSTFFKTCVKDHGDSSSRLLERRVWLVCINSLLFAVL